MTPDADIVVIGAGVAGLAAARSLARAGRDVLVLEQHELGHPHGSSHGASRIFRLSYPDARWVRLAQASLPLWEELEAEAGEGLILRTGTLDLGDVEPNRLALADAGAPYELLDAAAVAARWGISVPMDTRALFQPEGGITYAERTLRVLADGARDAGAEIRERARVADVTDEGGTVAVRVGGSTVRARAVVVAAGAWAPRLVDLEVVPTRETTSYFALDGDPALPSLIDMHDRGPGGQLAYALLAPGLGLKAGLHHSGPAVDPDDGGGPDAAVATWTAAWVARRFPATATEPLRVETCLYTNRADEDFVLERRGRVVVGSACSGHGFKFAPEVGRRLAALAVEAAV